jgi:hypothetical protein
VAHYIFNFVGEERATRSVRAGIWEVEEDEPHRSALAAGDLVLLYLGAPARTFVGRAVLGSAAHEGGVLLAEVEEWDPPVPMSAVLSQIDTSEGARADFDVGVVRITANEYETALAVAASRGG